MSTATSTISRSAPLPERSTASAWSMDSAWVTAAPRSIAILVAVVSWPFERSDDQESHGSLLFL